MRRNIFILLALTIVFFYNCKNEEDNIQLAPNAHRVEVLEAIPAGSYTYVRVEEGEAEKWLAITRREVEEGETYYYLDGMEMKNFHSKELNKTFESVLFIDNFSDQPFTASASPHDMNTPPGSKKSVTPKADVSVEPVSGGITIGELYSDKEKYNEKTILIRGVVTKFNEGIMGKNWVHIQDGTENDGSYDLTLTTDDVVNVGDLVTFEGSVALNKDFGFGYQYDVLIEVARLKE